MSDSFALWRVLCLHAEQSDKHDPDTLDALRDQSADAGDGVINELGELLPESLARRSLIGFVKSLDAGDAGGSGTVSRSQRMT